MDRISQLPESIVHHILSCLNTYEPPDLVRMSIDLVRMSVLSKTWFHLTASFPFLEFWIDDFTRNNVSPENFFKYVDYATSRFCLQNIPAHAFELRATLHEPVEYDIVNRCLESIFNKGVKVLDIGITYSSVSHCPSASTPKFPPWPSASTPRYRLPNTLLSVSVLESLTIRWCHLPSSLMLDTVKFKSLTCFNIQNVHIDDEVIKHLTTCCPLLQELDIRNCYGMKRLCVYGQRLQEVYFFYDTPVESIDIEAPNLFDLSIVDLQRNTSWPPPMNLASCKKLTIATYYGDPLPNSNFLSNFPFVESLCLVVTDTSCNLKLTSHSLRTLVLHSHSMDDNLEHIEFSTPDLVLFIYTPNYPSLPFMMPQLRDSTHLKACMQCNLIGNIDTLELFQNLRRFFDKKNGFKVLNLYFHAIKSVNFMKLEMLKAIKLPPYELEHVELHLGAHKESSDHVAFVDAVLWCCSPRSLTLRSFFPLTDFYDVVYKCTYLRLLRQEEEGHTNIRVVLPSSLEADKHYMELKSLSMKLPREVNTISFIKEEGPLYGMNWQNDDSPTSTSRPEDKSPVALRKPSARIKRRPIKMKD